MVVAALVAGCSPARPAPSVPADRTVAVGDGLEADLYLPDARPPGPATVVVLVPGGAWRSADNGGLAPLALRLRSARVAVANATYRAADDGVRFPVPVDDIVCDVRAAVAAVGDAGYTPGPVVLVGHSSGAHLAAIASLDGDRYGAGCRYPPAPVDAFAVLAGPYDPVEVAGEAEALFGAPPGDAPDLWRQGDPTALVADRPSLPVFLAHGLADLLVPVESTSAFAAALRAAGHPVESHLMPGVDHAQVYDPDVVGDELALWLAATAAG